MNNYSWVTFLSNDAYLCMVLMLNNSLVKQKSIYPLTCVTLKNSLSSESLNILKKLNMNIVEKEPLNLKKELISIYEGTNLTNWGKALSKPVIFDLEQFEKCVYLDADTYLMKNCDELFEKPNMSACIDALGIELLNIDWLYPGDNYFRMFNSGLLVYKPDKNITLEYEKCANSLDTTKGIRWADENILHIMFSNWRFNNHLKLDVYYNVFIGRLDDYMKTFWFNPLEIKIAHFTHKKPQQFTLNELKEGSKYSYYLKYCLNYVLELNELIKHLEKDNIVSSLLKIVD